MSFSRLVPRPFSIGRVASALGFEARPAPTAISLLRPTVAIPAQSRDFHASSRSANWLTPKSGIAPKTRKGRPAVRTGGSVRGTTVVWGDYGMRLTDHGRRLSANQLKNGEETIRRKLRGMNYRLYMRIACNIPVFTKGNESRMGTGKGSMDYWASRVPVSRIIFELKGEIHEKVAREAFRLAAQKMPGTYEFVRKDDPPVMGITKLTPDVVEKLAARKARFPMQRSLDAFRPPAGSSVITDVKQVKALATN